MPNADAMPATVAAAARRSTVRTTPLARQGALRAETGFPEGFGEVKAPLSSYHLANRRPWRIDMAQHADVGADNLDNDNSEGK
jgi:hypothetical protein